MLLGWATKQRPEAERVETGYRYAEKVRCRGTRGGIASLASGWRGLRRRCGHPMKRSATWPYFSKGCVLTLELGKSRIRRHRPVLSGCVVVGPTRDRRAV
jgi:hypothetical protein